MARKKISENLAKTILFTGLDSINDYIGFQVSAENIDEILEQANSTEVNKWVFKVDQGVKKRGKQGLIKVGITAAEIKSAIVEFAEKGYSQYILEPLYPHSDSEERYLSLSRTRDGIQVIYSESGGVNVEDAQDNLVKFYFGKDNFPSELINLEKFVDNLVDIFNKNQFVFLEINPLIVDSEGQFKILDLAVEVDSVASFFTENWDGIDFVDRIAADSAPEVEFIKKLDEKSQASLKLELLNPDGKFWLLFSGGGASITLADEFSNLGFGNEIGNYGEYSGNPNAEESYLYTKNVLELMLASNAEKKSLVIAGGVANFTDVRTTFSGVIRALKEYTEKLKQQKISVFVRRGGPHQEEGLAAMKSTLDEIGVVSEVHDPSLPLTEIVNLAIAELEK